MGLPATELSRHVEDGRGETLASATELACDVAAMHSRPAWLRDETGYPLKPIG